MRPRGTWGPRRRVGLAAAVPLMSLADGAFTHLALAAGLATEANPLMRLAWEVSPLAFHGAKAALVGAGTALLWVHRRHPMAGVALLVAAAAYAAVLAYHAVGLGSALPF